MPAPAGSGAESAPYLLKVTLGRAASSFAAAVTATANQQMRPLPVEDIFTVNREVRVRPLRAVCPSCFCVCP